MEKTTYDPQYLEVYVERSGSVNYSIYDNLQSSGWTAVSWQPGSVPSGYVIHEYDVNKLFVVGDYDDRFTINRGGNVGIGTTDPGDAKLKIYNSVNPYISLAHPDGDLLVAVATSAWNWAPESQPGDAVFKTRTGDGHHGIIFHMNDYNNDGNSYIKFNDIHNTHIMTILNNGRVGIGTTEPQSELAVEGKITAQEVEVTMDGWSDFVFDEKYQLANLSDVESFIKQNNHLPGVPSEKEVKENGLNIGKMGKILLQKIEELTLYVIELKKENEELRSKIQQLYEIKKK